MEIKVFVIASYPFNALDSCFTPNIDNLRFFFFILISLSGCLPIWLIFSVNQVCFHWFFFYFVSVFYFIDTTLFLNFLLSIYLLIFLASEYKKTRSFILGLFLNISTSCIHFPLDTALAIPPILTYWVFIFTQYEIFSKFLLTSSLTKASCIRISFKCRILGDFPDIFCYRLLDSFHCGHRTCSVWFHSFKIYWDSFYGPVCGLLYRTFHTYLKSMLIPPLLNVHFYKRQLGTFVNWVF